MITRASAKRPSHPRTPAEAPAIPTKRMNMAKIETKMLRTGGLPCICLRIRLEAMIGLHSLSSSLPFICAGKYPVTRPKLHLSEANVCQSQTCSRGFGPSRLFVSRALADPTLGRCLLPRVPVECRSCPLAAGRDPRCSMLDVHRGGFED